MTLAIGIEIAFAHWNMQRIIRLLGDFPVEEMDLHKLAAEFEWHIDDAERISVSLVVR